MLILLARFWAVLIIFIFGFALSAKILPLAVVALIIISAAAHEAIHCNLFDSAWGNRLYAAIAYGVVGHNAAIISGSHSLHHIYGRTPDVRFIVENRRPRGSLYGFFEYYGLLLGTGYYWNILGGYASIFLWGRRKYFYASDGVSYWYAIFCQSVVLSVHVGAISFLGWWYVVAVLMYGVYWGLSQNLPHYGLAMTDDVILRHAARSYSVPPILHFVFFGAIFSHLSHHVFQDTPGVMLNAEGMDEKVSGFFGFEMRRKRFYQYFVDMVSQFITPWPLEKYDWREES